MSCKTNSTQIMPENKNAPTRSEKQSFTTGIARIAQAWHLLLAIKQPYYEQHLRKK